MTPVLPLPHSPALPASSHVYLPGDRIIYDGQPATVICGHPTGRLYIRIAGVGDTLVSPDQLSQPIKEADAPAPASPSLVFGLSSFVSLTPAPASPPHPPPAPAYTSPPHPHTPFSSA